MDNKGNGTEKLSWGEFIFKTRLVLTEFAMYEYFL